MQGYIFQWKIPDYSLGFDLKIEGLDVFLCHPLGLGLEVCRYNDCVS